MFLLKKIASAGIVMVAGLCHLAAAGDAQAAKAAPAPAPRSFVNDDDRFMALRDASFHDDATKAEEHASYLANYDIPSYVDYYVLRTHIRSASATEVKAFISKYEGSAVADRLRNDWLLVLGYRGDWLNFDVQYPQFVVADDTQLKCYALLSRAIKNQKVAAEARTLLTSARDYGEGCYTLVTYLSENGQFSPEDIWNQIRLASENGALPLAQRLAKNLQVKDARVAQAFEKPGLILSKPPESGKSAHELYIIALGRNAKSDPQQAAATLAKNAAKFSEAERALAWGQIGLQSSLKLQPEALQYWRQADGAPLSLDAYQWRARIALRAGDWKMLKAAIAAMPPSLRNEPTWIYWQGRALKSEGKNEEAQALFQGIADQVHFYGQLSLEELGQKVGVPVTVKPLAPAEMDAVAQNPGLQRALKFYQMNLRLEGTREWNWELRKMSERQHLAAAELARQNNLLDRMVNTSDRTKTEMDFTQRYPTPFNDVMYKSTKLLGLDMAWVYGLIRQESRFVMTARSHVGASGLMQIMPSTARYVAKKMGLGDFVPNQVNDIETNIALGTNYLNMVLTDLGGSQAMASAAYNAGPGRPRAWRASLTRPVEGAIFAETIPFNETRSYVKNVLSNATYYAALFEKKPQSLKARLGTVAPKGMSGNDGDLPQDLNGTTKTD
ncbi:transglycosylase SLT domain-containing protein [Undibacterium sp.]|uniref:lytic transglycosylase domain-containing protein n=1 Tax=Undibacterium sp. TaxID=1914977 RepID=UPI00374D076B